MLSGPPGLILKKPWKSLGASRAYPGASGGILVAPGRARRAPQVDSSSPQIKWSDATCFWAILESSWSRLGAPLKPLGVLLSLSWGFRRNSGGPREGPKSAPSRPQDAPTASGATPLAFELSWSLLGKPSWAPWKSLGASRAYPGASCGILVAPGRARRAPQVDSRRPPKQVE